MDILITWIKPYLRREDQKMAPGLETSLGTKGIDHNERSKKPLQPTGLLEKFEYEDSTPAVGREYPYLDLVGDVLNSPDAESIIQDLAIASELPFTFSKAAG